MIYTYPLSRPAAFLIDEDAAAAVMLRDYYENGQDGLPPDVVDLVREKGPYPAAMSLDDGSENHSRLLDELRDVQLAAELLDGTYGLPCAIMSEFCGAANTLPGTGPDAVPSKEWKYEAGFLAFLPTEREQSLFGAAYPDMDAVVKEFKDKLLPVLGPNFPYRTHVVSVSGVYSV